MNWNEPPKSVEGIVSDISREAAQTPLSASIDFQRDEIFLLYASFCGDVDRTSYAANTSPEEVLRLAKEGEWDQRLRKILELRKSQRPGDVERAVNRAINFVQAHRMRLILEAVIRRITALSPAELIEATTTRQLGKNGEIIKESLSTRPLADLTAALEKCHSLTYQALNDTATERKMRPAEADNEDSAGEIHAKLAAAFAKPVSQSCEPK